MPTPRVPATTAPVKPALSPWLASHTYRSNDVSVADLLDRKTETVAVVLPARQVAATIGPIVSSLAHLQKLGLIEELLVVDAHSSDGTSEIASEAGATVVQRDEVLDHYGPASGKGDALWRGVSVTASEIVVFMDTDTQNFGEHFLLGLLRPLFERRDLHLVKGAFRRPFKVGGRRFPDEGGRVTELVARPLLNLYLPQLAGFVQPLAGEVALRRWLFESFSIPVGYGVEIGMLIDAYRTVGLEGMAQVDLGTRVDDPQHLRDLGSMAYAVMATLLERAKVSDHAAHGALMVPTGGSLEVKNVSLEERPPLETLQRDDASGL